MVHSPPLRPLPLSCPPLTSRLSASPRPRCQVLGGLTKIQDAIDALLSSEELNLQYEGVPLSAKNFLQKVLSRCSHAAAAPPPLGGSPSLSASASSQPATQGGGGSFKEA